MSRIGKMPIEIPQGVERLHQADGNAQTQQPPRHRRAATVKHHLLGADGQR